MDIDPVTAASLNVLSMATSGTMVATKPIPSPQTSDGRHCDTTSRSYSSASSSISGRQSTLASSYSSTASSTVYQKFDRCPTKTALPTISDDGGFTVPGTTLKAYNKEMSDTLRSQFCDFQRQYSTALGDEILKKLRPSRFNVLRKNRAAANPGLSMKCKYLGTSEATAKLYIVIQCDKAVSKIVAELFNQRHVANDLKGDFEICIIDDGFIKFGATEDVSVFGDALESTVFGRRVNLRLGHASRWATLGGVISITIPRAGAVVFGLLAGHPVADIRDDIEFESASSDDDESIEGCSLDCDERGLDSSISDSSSGSPMVHIFSNVKGSTVEDEGILRPNYEKHLGQVTHDSFGYEREPNYDWALIELRNGDQYYNAAENDFDFDIFKSWTYPDLTRDDFNPFQRHIDAVAITSHGIQEGIMFRDRSSILLLPGTELVETFRFTLKPGSGKPCSSILWCSSSGLTIYIDLTYGDSGCWIVDHNGHLQGHLVAMDVFREAYIMPISGTMSSIRSKMQGTLIAIPHHHYLWAIVTCQRLRSGDVKGYLQLKSFLSRPSYAQPAVSTAQDTLFRFPLVNPPSYKHV